MSDTRLRELERLWKETGSSDDEAAYLLERVRVGDLTQERLELAAYSGHEGALLCVNVAPPEDLVPWLRGLTAPNLVLERAAADCALTALASLPPHEVADLRWETIRAALAAWADAPGSERAAEFEAANALVHGLPLPTAEAEETILALGCVLLAPVRSLASAAALIGARKVKHSVAAFALGHAGSGGVTPGVISDSG
ncbi:MAG: hypothetical protein KF878_30690 [Planctomycetes bacterium]|nr:hypothetical protein [Planctomycetota bacterium]